MVRMQGARKCDVWGVLFTPPVGCSRLLSAVNDLTTTFFLKKKSKVSLWAAKWRSRFNGSPRSVMPLISRAQKCLTLMNLMSSTSDRSTATMVCWMKKTTHAISDTARKESVQVALLQTHGEDGASLLMLRWSLTRVSSVHFVQMCWEIDQVFLYLSYSSDDRR